MRSRQGSIHLFYALLGLVFLAETFVKFIQNVRRKVIVAILIIFFEVLLPKPEYDYE